MRDRDPEVADEAAQCPSGVHWRTPAAPRAPSLAQIVHAVREVEPTSFVAVVLEPCCGHGARGGIARSRSDHIESKPGWPSRLRLWTRAVSVAATVPVPLLLQAIVPVGSALVVPIASPVWTAGALVVSGGSLLDARLTLLRSVAADIALRLEAADRAYSRSRDAHDRAQRYIVSISSAARDATR